MHNRSANRERENKERPRLERCHSLWLALYHVEFLPPLLDKLVPVEADEPVEGEPEVDAVLVAVAQGLAGFEGEGLALRSLRHGLMKLDCFCLVANVLEGFCFVPCPSWISSVVLQAKIALSPECHCEY